MPKIKFNSNYIKNAENLSQINQIVDAVIAEKNTKKPFDFLFRRNSETYPKTTHQVLGLPGIFKQVETPTVYTQDGRSLQQDYVESVLPDGKSILKESTVGVEQQSYLVDPDKSEIIFWYKLENIKKHEKPSIPVIVTNIDYKTDELICKINGEVFNIKVIYYSPERIDKILNTISAKDYSKEEMSEADFIKLVHCLIFATKEHAEDVIKRVVNIFASCEKIQDKHQMDLHLALRIMIKYRFKEEKELRRLLTMITRAVNENKICDFLDYQELLQKSTETISEIKSENARIKSENARIKSENAEIKSENAELKKKLREIKILQN